MDWKQDWIDLVLDEVPQGAYRKRLEAELRDHLETQCRAFMDAGRTQDEAQTEALCVMGTPEKLKEEYEAAWRRSPAVRVRRGVDIAASCAIMWVLHYVIVMLLLMFYFFMGDDWEVYMGFMGKLPYELFHTLFLFLIPAGVGGLYLFFRAGREHRPARMITTGLLTAWLGGRAILLSMWWISTLPLDKMLSELLALFVSFPGFFPIFSPFYMAVTFAGCILLGQFFGRFAAQEGTPAAA